MTRHMLAAFLAVATIQVGHATAETRGPKESQSEFAAIPTVNGERRGFSKNGTKFVYREDYARFTEKELSKPFADDASEWTVGCENDAMTDKRNCKLENPKSIFYLETEGSAKALNLCIYNHTFPGRTAQIRIGEAKPSATDSGCFAYSPSLAFIRQMVTGTRVRVRYFEWPYDEPRDGEYTITNAFVDAVSWMNFWYSGGTQNMLWVAPANSVSGRP